MARREDTMRMCALTRTERPVGEMIRFVLGPDGMLVPDTEAKAEGRGVWITLSQAAVAEAVKRKAFSRSLKCEVKLPDDLPGLTRLRLEQRVLSALGLARKAGQMVFGSAKVRSQIDGGDMLALITAADAAPDGRAKLLSPLKARNHAVREAGHADEQVLHFELLTSEQLGLALGLENVIHAALTKGAAAQSAVDKARRLAHFIAPATDEGTGRPAVDGVSLPAASVQGP